MGGDRVGVRVVNKAISHHLNSNLIMESGFIIFALEVCQELRSMKGVLNDHLKTLRDFLVDLRSNHGDSIKGMIFVETRATAFALAKYITEELEMMKFKAAPFTGSKSSDSSEG